LWIKFSEQEAQVQGKLVWLKKTGQEKMQFESEIGGYKIPLDAKAPMGLGQGPTPKELVALGLGGCTVMDVIALLNKHKQDVKSLECTVDIEQSQGKTPAVFEKAVITFTAQGPIDPKILTESVMLSQTKYCGVSKMLSASFPITYKVLLNDELVSEGSAKFL
jgi:putative redox protein